MFDLRHTIRQGPLRPRSKHKRHAQGDFQTTTISCSIPDYDVHTARRFVDPIPRRGIKNMLVRIKNSFILADFFVLDMEGDTGIQLILGRPFLKDVKAQIDVGASKIRFCIGTDNIFFKFQYRTEQKFILH